MVQTGEEPCYQQDLSLVLNLLLLKQDNKVIMYGTIRPREVGGSTSTGTSDFLRHPQSRSYKARAMSLKAV